MRPPKRDPKDYEKVAIGEFVFGHIVDVQYDMEHKFKGFQGAEDRIVPAVRFVFELEGYNHKHYSRWMTFNVGEKSNLYQKYLTKLVQNAMPDMDIDLDVLKGMRVKTIWSEKNDYQAIESIFAASNKVSINDIPPSNIEEEPTVNEEVPF